MRRLRRRRRIFACILALCLAFTCSCVSGCGGLKTESYFEGDALSYYQSLIAEGFPADYATALTELHLLHPTWTFHALNISETDARFDWSYVIRQEIAEPDRSMINGSDQYSAYHHRDDPYRSAGSCQASREAVAYFMDPRNFLNETDIFQFFDLSASKNTSISAVEAVLVGTFMEGTVLENGKTYAQNFYEIGAELGVDPVYLAVKARQEQGTRGASPVISGTCGTTLWNFCVSGKQTTEDGAMIYAPRVDDVSKGELLALDGYYNIYNIGAYGNGVYEIYQKAMLRAQTGSDRMRAAWGGDASWNTVWKSVYGGALFIKESYIDRYQSTPYLQKFNVDGRSGRNFWGQYAQNIADALSQSRILFQAVCDIGALDGAYTFLIPVYRGMSEHPSRDPALGFCRSVAQATDRYTYSVAITDPEKGEAKNGALYGSVRIKQGKALAVVGNVSHHYGIRAIEYAIDGGKWQPVSANGEMNFSVYVGDTKGETHILVIRGIADYDKTDSAKKSNQTVLCAVLYITVT